MLSKVVKLVPKGNSSALSVLPAIRSKSTVVQTETSTQSHDPYAPRKDLEAFWMPFTDNRRYKANPRVFSRAKGMSMWTEDGTEKLDGISGLWTTSAGHCQPHIIEAIQKQAAKLDFCSNFNVGHELPFEFAQRILDLIPNRGFGKVFFTGSGSSSIDSAMKMSLAYHRAKGQGQRTRFIGRQRAYHGVGLAGISVGGLLPNKQAFSGVTVQQCSHISHTLNYAKNAFTKGQPEHGKELADEVEAQIALYGADTIAAVFMEPVAGSTGVLPPPKGYLKRLRDICTKHGILLIFDEVITGFGRLGTPFATQKFDVTPDLITCAKGLTNGAVPAGAVICQQHLYDAIANDTYKQHGSHVEFFHGYTYSGHPLAMAAGIATLDVYRDQALFERCAELAPYFEEAIHSLKGLPLVVDIRNIGLMGAIDLEVEPGRPMARTTDVFERSFDDENVLIRHSGSAIALCPAFVATKTDIDRMVDAVSKSIKASAAAGLPHT